MNGAPELWMNAYETREFLFEGLRAILVFPKPANAKNAWVFKIEYFTAFQNLELALVQRGCHLAFLQCKSRWATREDTETRLRFRDFLVREYGLCPRCVPVGMSAGGAGAIRLAARAPEAVAALYLDAPVVNFLSCPFGMGAGTTLDEAAKAEWQSAYHISPSDLIAYRAHPLDEIPALIRARVPAALVCGDADQIVPFPENGRYVRDAYAKSDIPFLFEMKPGCGHHPHGPANVDAVADFLFGFARS